MKRTNAEVPDTKITTFTIGNKLILIKFMRGHQHLPQSTTDPSTIITSQQRLATL